MSIIQRYKKLTFWNKLGAWGSIASIIALIWTFWPSKESPIITVSGGINQIGGSGNTQTVINPEVTNELRNLNAKVQQALNPLFRPLALSVQSNLIDTLKDIQAKYGTNIIKVSFRSVSHDKNTLLLEDEWIKILKDAGFQADIGMNGSVFYRGRAPDVALSANSGEQELRERFCGAMQQLIHVQFHIDHREMPTSWLQVTLNGIPEFDTNGTAFFQQVQ